MSKILFLTTTPTIGGNGDKLIHTAIEEAKKNGAEIKLVNIREKQIGFCKACYGCAKTEQIIWKKQKKLHIGQCKYKYHGAKNNKTNCFYKLSYFKHSSYWM